MANRWWIGWTLALVASTCAGAAFAQSDADMAARRLLLEQAQQARTGGDHTRALDLASRAGRISMTASVRRFIAEEENSLGRYASALGSFGCLVTEQAGAAILFFGAAWGLYVVGLGMMASFVFMVSGAWLLLVGVESSQAGRKGAEPESARP